MAEKHKTIIDEDFIRRLCKDNVEAQVFFMAWYHWVHQIDDLVDKVATLPEGSKGLVPTAADRELIIKTFAQSMVVMSQPFYLKNVFALRQVAFLIANRYADTVKWENEPREAWQKTYADLHRGVAMEMAMAIALICGGWDHARSLSAELTEICYHSHHDEAGNPR